MNIYRQALQSSAHSTKISAFIVFARVCIVHGYENVAIGDCWQKKKLNNIPCRPCEVCVLCDRVAADSNRRHIYIEYIYKHPHVYLSLYNIYVCIRIHKAQSAHIYENRVKCIKFVWFTPTLYNIQLYIAGIGTNILFYSHFD